MFASKEVGRGYHMLFKRKAVGTWLVRRIAALVDQKDMKAETYLHRSTPD